MATECESARAGRLAEAADGAFGGRSWCSPLVDLHPSLCSTPSTAAARPSLPCSTDALSPARSRSSSSHSSSPTSTSADPRLRLVSPAQSSACAAPLPGCPPSFRPTSPSRPPSPPRHPRPPPIRRTRARRWRPGPQPALQMERRSTTRQRSGQHSSRRYRASKSSAAASRPSFLLTVVRPTLSLSSEVWRTLAP